MNFTKDFSEFIPWSGAVSTYELIKKEDKLDELEHLLEDIFCDSIPTETEINDLLWFESDMVLEALGLKEPEDEED